MALALAEVKLSVEVPPLTVNDDAPKVQGEAEVKVIVPEPRFTVLALETRELNEPMLTD
jgi:hypothetical protein